ncbi:flagellar hook assembly protein FlgD [Thermodesulfatator atlanticus]|uniref:flagellar hook assembly protein FlgD n=1 Tax=Thermodesulfatator atlanticus TaxID=501497 RepID=UPI0003B40C54|nr:FlgD immunoglobulin-like domain containing protein [Thermodesulfatator atlanticus]
MISGKTQLEEKPSLFQEVDTNKPKIREPKKVLDRDDFMVLFIKQLEFQDPLKPLENNEMATQLALFNQVDQLFDLNEKIKQLVDIAQNDNLQTISGLIGKKALVKSSTGRVENGNFLGGKLILEQPINDVALKIYDEKGKLIKTLDIGALSAGEHSIDWDAKDKDGNPVSDGNYRFYVETPTAEEKSYVTIKTVGRITGALLEDNKYQLLFNGHEEIDLSELEKIMAEEA